MAPKTNIGIYIKNSSSADIHSFSGALFSLVMDYLQISVEQAMSSLGLISENIRKSNILISGFKQSLYNIVLGENDYLSADYSFTDNIAADILELYKVKQQFISLFEDSFKQKCRAYSIFCMKCMTLLKVDTLIFEGPLCITQWPVAKLAKGFEVTLSDLSMDRALLFIYTCFGAQTNSLPTFKLISSGHGYINQCNPEMGDTRINLFLGSKCKKKGSNSRSITDSGAPKGQWNLAEIVVLSLKTSFTDHNDVDLFIAKLYSLGSRGVSVSSTSNRVNFSDSRMSDLFSVEVIIDPESVSEISEYLFEFNPGISIDYHKISQARLHHTDRIYTTSIGKITARSYNMPGHNRRVIPDSESIAAIAVKNDITLSRARKIFYEEIRDKLSGNEAL